MHCTHRPGVLAILLALVPAVALAYPISPEPLWSLTARADLIVVAEVTRLKELPQDDDDWDSAAASLKVIETLKGPRLNRVEVPFPANLMCPAPPVYLTGERVVAFLARDGEAWQTVALSYGTLYPQGAELEDVKTMVSAALVIQNSTVTAEEKGQHKLDWLVQAAALPGTRWHGLYELAPTTDRIRSFYDQLGRLGGSQLTKGHHNLLAEAFVKAPKVDPTVAMMLRVLGNHTDPQVDHFAVGVLEGLLALDQPPWWAQDLLWAVLARYGDTQLESRLKTIGIESWDVTPMHLRSLWSEAKAELGVPEVPPIEIHLDRYLPVAGRTPS